MFKIRKHLNNRAFTLTEILITIVILGVIAGLATPTYFKSVEQSRVNEATVNLNAIYMAQKIYALNNSGNFWNGGANPAVATINSTLNIDINPQYYPVISITAANGGNPKTFTATVMRNALQGGDGITRYTIDQTGTITISAIA